MRSRCPDGRLILSSRWLSLQSWRQQRHICIAHGHHGKRAAINRSIVGPADFNGDGRPTFCRNLNTVVIWEESPLTLTDRYKQKGVVATVKIEKRGVRDAAAQSLPHNTLRHVQGSCRPRVTLLKGARIDKDNIYQKGVLPDGLWHWSLGTNREVAGCGYH